MLSNAVVIATLRVNLLISIREHNVEGIYWSPFANMIPIGNDSVCAATSENVPLVMCTQQRFRSASTFACCDQAPRL